MSLAPAWSRIAIVRQGVWVAAGQVIVALGMVATTRLVTQFATLEVVGTVSLMMAIAGFARGLFAVPISLAATRFWPDLSNEGRLPVLRSVVTRSLILTTAGVAAVLLLAGLVLGPYWRLGPILFILAVALFALDAFRIQQTDYLSAARRQKPAALIRSAEAILKPLLIVPAMLLISPSPQTILSGHIAATAVVLTGVWMIRPWIWDRRSPAASSPLEAHALTQRLWLYARPLIPITLFTYIMSISDRLMIEPLAGRASLGLYSAVYGLGSLPILMLGMILETTIRPAYYHAVSANRPQAARIFRRWVLITAIAGILACLTIHLLRQPIVTLLLGPDFRSRPDLLLPIAAGHVFYILAVVFERYCHARHRTRPSLLIYGLGAAACLISQAPLISMYGITGAAIAVPIYYGVMLVVAIVMALRSPTRI